MNDRLARFSRQYAPALRSFLRRQHEAGLELAYELGRLAVARGLGILDVARIHQEALARLLVPPLKLDAHARVLRAAESFLLESLSPFEATHRGFKETNSQLHLLIETLKKRNVELRREISRRRRSERALRRSEEHLRAMFNESRLMEESLRSLSNQILHAQEEERKRVSRELHDQVGQALAAINVNLGALRHNAATEPRLVRKNLAGAQQLLRQTMEVVHHFARELRPSMLDELGLIPTLRSYLKEFARRTGLRVRLGATPAAEQLDGDRKLVLFRVAQESLTNVAKHAHATRVDVTLRKTDQAISMEIVDNGKSFKEDPLDFARRKRRLGLLGMQERVRLVNGHLTVKPDPGRQTIVRVTIPLPSPPPPLRIRWRSGAPN